MINQHSMRQCHAARLAWTSIMIHQIIIVAWTRAHLGSKFCSNMLVGLRPSRAFQQWGNWLRQSPSSLLRGSGATSDWRYLWSLVAAYYVLCTRGVLVAAYCALCTKTPLAQSYDSTTYYGRTIVRSTCYNAHTPHIRISAVSHFSGAFCFATVRTAVQYIIKPPSGYSLTEFFLNIYGVSIHLSLVFEVCCTIPGMLCVGTRPHSTPTYFHTLLLCYPGKQISHWKCYASLMHHIIPNRYIYPTDGFYI